MCANAQQASPPGKRIGDMLLTSRGAAMAVRNMWWAVRAEKSADVSAQKGEMKRNARTAMPMPKYRCRFSGWRRRRRSGEHTTELQSLMRHYYAVFSLKKKKKILKDK